MSTSPERPHCQLSARQAGLAAAPPQTRAGRWAAVLLAACVAGCGGGGGGGDGAGTAVSSGGQTIMLFPLQAAYKAYVVNGYSKQFTVGGDCTGTAVQNSSSPPQDAVFDNKPAHAITLTGALQLSGCGTSQSVSASVQYFDDSYRTLGAAATDGSIARYDVPLAMPAFVAAGYGGTLGTEQLFASSTASAPNGRTVQGYRVVAETDTTVLVRLTADTYDTANKLLVTQTAVYRLGANATFDPVSIEVSYPGGSGLHLVLTPQ